MTPAGGTTAIAILAAQVEELAPLLARIGARHDGRDDHARYWRSDLDSVTAAVSGVGRRRARAAAAALLDRSAASRLIVIGVAGALTADLEIGAVVVARTVIADDGPPLETNPAGVRAAVDLGARPGIAVTVDRLVATVADRSRLGRWALEEAGAGPASVDMESYDAVAAASARGVSAMVLRVVSDTSSEELPSFLERARRADGDLDRRRAALLALAHPRSIPVLFALRRRVRRGSAALADLVARLIAPSSAPGSP